MFVGFRCPPSIPKVLAVVSELASRRRSSKGCVIRFIMREKDEQLEIVKCDIESSPKTYDLINREEMSGGCAE